MDSVDERRLRRSGSFALAIVASFVFGPCSKSIAEEPGHVGDVNQYTLARHDKGTSDNACHPSKHGLAESGAIENSFNASLAGGVVQSGVGGTEAVVRPSMRLPLDTITISSGFGLRPDPLDGSPPGVSTSTSAGGSSAGVGGKGVAINVATARGIALGLAPAPTIKRPRKMQVLFMHQGLDLAAPLGTPIYAASDGIVSGAAPNGGYGNWMRIEHSRNVATVYGHLSAYASGITAGTPVSQGQLVGFVGSTGRSTGPHLHFEILDKGTAIDPLSFPGIRRERLQATGLEHIRAQLTQAANGRGSNDAGAVHGDCSQ